jgi:hypothetical protein
MPNFLLQLRQTLLGLWEVAYREYQSNRITSTRLRPHRVLVGDDLFSGPNGKGG